MPTGKELADRWDLNVRQVLFGAWGQYYGLLNKFPAALTDPNGYLIIESMEHLQSFFPNIKVTKKINVKDPGISSINGYVQMESIIPEEMAGSDTKFIEGNKVTINVNKYERDQKARIECIKIHGSKCLVCGLDLSSIYGIELKGFIHVHHTKPISAIGHEYVVDPQKDLVPLCPNCHAIIHFFKPALTVEQLKDRMKLNNQ